MPQTRRNYMRRRPYPRNSYLNRSISLENINESESETSDINNSVSNNFNMSTTGNRATEQVVQITPTDIFNSLRVPDAIKDLPRFDGNPRLLFDFINNVEEILSLVKVTKDTPYEKLLLRAIRNKIDGSANEVLNMYGTPLDWDQIKQNLILHYADKRNETSLIRDLHDIKQNNKSVEKFYSEIIETLATINNHIKIHETENSVVNAKRDLYTEMCLNAFLSGLKEPLGSTIRAMKPLTLASAFAYCIEEQNIFYSKQSSNKLSGSNNPHSFIPQVRNVYPQQRQTMLSNNQVLNKPLYQSSFNPLHYQPQQRQSFNTQIHPQQRQFYYTQNQPQPRQFFNTQNRPQLPKPEPMDIGSGHSHLRQKTQFQPSQQSQPQQNKFFRSTGPSRFSSRELFNISMDEPESHPEFEPNFEFEHCLDVEPNYKYQQHLDQYYNNSNYNPSSAKVESEIENFQKQASADRSDT